MRSDHEPVPDAGKLEILLVSGSVRSPSHTCALAEHVERALWRHDVATTLWNLREQPLPIADPEHHDDPRTHGDAFVRAFVSAADRSSALVLASPIYHNSYSGVLKNALDHLAIQQFQYKPVGLVGHGARRSPQAVDHLRIVVRGLRGVAIPSQVCTERHDYRADETGAYELESRDVLDRIERLAAEIVVLAYVMRSGRGAAMVT